MSSCGENLFHPGLSGVRCAAASGIKSKERPRKKPAANPRCALGSHSSRPAFLLRVFQFDQRILTTTSQKPCDVGWRFLVQGYFSTRCGGKEKARAAGTRAESERKE